MRDLTDIGANLAHASFDADRDAVIRRAQAAGVSRLIVTGSDTQSNAAASQLAQDYPGVLFATAGLHPHHASEYDNSVQRQISGLAANKHIVAVGECGLDYFRDLSPRGLQRIAFQAQLDIAVDCGLPVFLHQRDALDDFIEVLEPMLPKLSRCVAHCFTGDDEAMTALLAMNLYIGVTGWICDERRGQDLRKSVRLIPDNRLMIETDAPYLLPRSLRPKPDTRRNEPMWLTEVLRTLAIARDQSEADLAEITHLNAARFFALG